jgi:crossover junction endodeoxyribonuclease RuvC
MSLIVGIDPSLTSTGIVVLRGGEVELAETIKTKSNYSLIHRVSVIYRAITNLVEGLTPDLIVIEGFSYGSKGRAVFEIAYLGWRIREEIERFKEQDGIPWIEVPPAQLKKFATGKGTANKGVIMQQVYKRWGFEASDNNVADAFVLAKIGQAYLGEFGELTAFQESVITALRKEESLCQKEEVLV